MDLPEMRAEIDRLDTQLIEVLAARFKVGDAVGRYKAEHDLPARDEQREADMMQRIRADAADKGLDPEIAERVVRQILDATVARHEAIRGPER